MHHCPWLFLSLILLSTLKGISSRELTITGVADKVYRAVPLLPGEDADLSVVLQAQPRKLGGDSDFFFFNPVTVFTADQVEANTWHIRLTAPVREGLFTIDILDENDALLRPILVEVSCSDLISCNGIERLVNGECVSSPPLCDDGWECTSDVCSLNGVCSWTLNSDPTRKCPECASNGNCQPKCRDKGVDFECGDDGCGGTCGSPCLEGTFCISGVCGTVASSGSLGNPFDLLEEAKLSKGGGTSDDTLVSLSPFYIFNDTSTGIHVLSPPCNTESKAKELYYKFEVPEGGLHADIRIQSATGNPSDLDMIMAFLKCDKDTGVCDFFEDAFYTCLDDSTPPGGVGSGSQRPFSEPGTYLIMVDGFSATQVGPFVLSANFYYDCTPRCDGKYCGDNSCGGSCFLAPSGTGVTFEGDCTSQEICDSKGRCAPASSNCVPDCNGRSCGSDGCGGECGYCNEPEELCLLESGKCRRFDICDHLKPDCKSCPRNQYCGSDCECHKVDEPLIDLLVNRKRLLEESFLEEKIFEESACPISEDCIVDLPPGTPHLLFRFTVDVTNQGRGGFKPPPPSERPDLFEWGVCHGHYHFRNFANFYLLDLEGNQLTEGSKRSFCMEDSYQHHIVPWASCFPTSTCNDQGIQPGWSDIYPAVLDCQWIDVSLLRDRIEQGEVFTLEVCTNLGRVFHEMSFENNCMTTEVKFDLVQMKPVYGPF